MSKIKKVISLLLACMLLPAIFAGCGSGSADDDNLVATEAPAVTDQITPIDSSDSDADTDAAQTDAPVSVYPLAGAPIEVSLWMENLTRVTSPIDITEMSGFQMWDSVEEATGVELSLVTASSDLASEQFNIMVTSGDYCDLISGVHNYYNTGVAGAINDDVIIDISGYMDKYLPNYSEYLNADTDLLASSKLDASGTIGEVMMVYSYRVATWGLAIRQDWLDELNLSVPETIDDMHDVLTAFKTNYGISHALLLTQSVGYDDAEIASAYGVSGYCLEGQRANSHLYQVDGTVHSSFIEDGYRQYLETLHNWYGEGLISSDFTSIPSICFAEENMQPIANGETGIFYMNASFASELPAMQTNENYTIAPISSPALNKGDEIQNYTDLQMFTTANTVSVSTECENIEAALRYVDWWYTRDGYLTTNYGVEGVSYELDENGEPQWDEDNIVNSPYLSEYAYRAIIQPYAVNNNIPFGVINEDKDSCFDPETTLQCKQLWSQADNSRLIPAISFTDDETTELARLLTDIETYASENIAKFITGDKPLSDWDSFEAQLKNMGIERVIEIYQNAVDRFYANV